MRLHVRALSTLLGLGTLVVAQVAGPAPAAAAAPDFPDNMSGYHNYPEMVGEIRQAEADFPDLVEVSSIGKSYKGRDIWIAKVSDNVAEDEDEPEVLIDALHHAREHLTTEQALATLRWLTRDYGSDQKITDLVDSREIWIVVALNPDGMQYDLTGDPFRAWRKNRQPNAGPERRHRPQPQLRLSLGLLQGLVGQPEVAHVSGARALLRAGDPGAPRLRGEPRRARHPADPDPRDPAHQWPAHPVAVRLHEEGRPARHDRARPPDLRGAGQGDGAHQRLQGRAVVRPVHHRRRPDRLALREVPDLHLHLRAVPAREGDRLGRPLPRRLEDRQADRPQPRGAADADRPRGLPVRRARRRGAPGRLRAGVRRPRDQPRLDARPARQRHGVVRPVGDHQPRVDQVARSEAAGYTRSPARARS